MEAVQIVALVISLGITVVAVALFVRAIRQILAVVRLGQPASRSNQPGARWVTLARESLLHTRMLAWTWVGAAHWFVFVGFGLLFFTLLTAFGQLFDPRFALPLIGHFFLYEWLSEFFTFVMLIAIVGFIGYRATRPKERVRGARGRFWGSTMWQGYFVEAVILGVGLCIAVLRGLEYALLSAGGEHAEDATAFHFPFFFWLCEAFSGLSVATLENLIWVVATLKIVISFTWMITIALTPTMGVAWHRFTAWFNIWFKREATGGVALGALKPLTSAGRPVGLAELEELEETASLGVGRVEDLTWKGMLDLTSCTECGRCQSQCPAWNTEKPLSPKLLITALRDHAYAKAPALLADDREAVLVGGRDGLAREAARPLVGETGDDWFYMPESGAAVIDPEVLWSCTTCGACVQQCPVDIEHVDHIVDMRRYQLLVESNFPAELSGLFRGLENKGNPWNMATAARLEWAQGLDFDVPVVGEDVTSLDEVEWLFWVGCAGAYEDRAKKTTRAVAELLHRAGVSFAVLGNGETCTGDPARRAGNEFVFLGLAGQNVETLREAGARKVVATCAHCFNTLKNEYSSLGINLEVVHHTQLLNRLVREGKLTPVSPNGAGAANASGSAGGSGRTITYHDPCYLGRHNQVYSPPRELLSVLPGTELAEMPRNSERSFCCGAGGARMWMEERTGERINANRTAEALATGAEQIAVGCPFCRVMLSDGLTAAQASGQASAEVEVLDVAQMLLAAVQSGPVVEPVETKAEPPSPVVEPVETKAEPEPGDVTVSASTVTATEDVGPLAKASGGTSLFDAPAPPVPSTSLFDVPTPASPPAAPPAPSSLFDAPTTQPAPAEKPTSLFDVPTPEPAPAEKPTSLFDVPTPEPAPAEKPTSLFDVPAAPSAPTEPPAPARTGLFDAPTSTPPADTPPAPTDAHQPRTDLDLDALDSLFDIPAPDVTLAPATRRTAPAPTPDATATPSGDPAPAPAAVTAQEPATRESSSPPAASSPPGGPSTTTTPVGHAPRADVDLEQVSSLFDVPAPATPAPAPPTPAPPPTSVPGLFDRPADPAPAPTPVPGLFDRPSDASLPMAEPSPERVASPAPAPAAAPETGAQDAPDSRPASAPTHQPRTDLDIDALDSLFDL